MICMSVQVAKVNEYWPRVEHIYSGMQLSYELHHAQLLVATVCSWVVNIIMWHNMPVL